MVWKEIKKKQGGGGVGGLHFCQGGFIWVLRIPIIMLRLIVCCIETEISQLNY